MQTYMHNFTLPGKIWIRNQPLLFSTFWKLKENRHLQRRVVRRGDAAVIEGFPRSANTFASVAFSMSQQSAVLFGNHFHSPAQFQLARKYKVPALLLMREPLDAAKSYVLFSGGRITAIEALLRYIGFHTPLIDIQGSFVVARFEEVISDFSKPIERLNSQFNVNFSTFSHTPDNVKAVFAQIACRQAERVKLGVVAGREGQSTIPTAQKARLKELVEPLFDSDELKRPLSTAQALYERLTTAS